MNKHLFFVGMIQSEWNFLNWRDFVQSRTFMRTYTRKQILRKEELAILIELLGELYERT